MNSFGELYDALATHESSRNKIPYPVHKTLNFTDQESNLLNFICQKTSFSNTDVVLDAGSGNGYSLITLTETYGLTGLGISLSHVEISLAKHAARKKNQKLKFVVKSFDEVEGKYSKILAIESLRHSPDLTRTISHLASLLQPGGELIIADDYVIKEMNKFKTHKDLWQSPSLTYLHDVIRLLKSHNLTVKSFDLSRYTVIRSKWSLKLCLLVSEILRRIVFGRHVFSLNAYSGGLILEKLYHKGLVTYNVIIAKKSGNGKEI